MAISPVPAKNQFSKNFGGTNRGVADSAMMGYFYTFFLDVPEQLRSLIIPGVADAFKGPSDIPTYLSALCTNIDGFDVTHGKTTSNGVGNTRYHEATTVDTGDSVSTTFKELQNLPISRIFHSWSKLMNDYRTGGAHYRVGAGNTSKNYKCTILEVTTLSDWDTIEHAVMYTGCFPDKDPLSQRTSQSITNIDKMSDINISWSVDAHFDGWDYQWVMDQARAWVNTMKDDIENVRNGVFNGPSTL